MGIDILHTLTHKVPGVPEHGTVTPAQHERSHEHAHASATHAAHRNPVHVHSTPPRVFVRWQNWIASLGTGGRRSADG